MKIKGFQFPTEPKVSFYAPEDKSYNFELLKKIRQVLQMIKEIKTNNVEKGNELEKELKEIVGVKNENYYDQLNMGDKIDEMYERVSIIYNGQPLRSKIMEQIELNTEYLKNNLSSITVAEILKIIESIDNNIGQLLELNDIVDMSKLFDEFRALCISIYYRKKDGNVQNDSVFQELIGDFNTKLALDTYISELNINDKEYKRIRANSDDIEYLENPEIWKIVSDHLGVPILAESEVLTEDNNILADNNNTSLAIPNSQRRSLGEIIYAAFVKFISLFQEHASTENGAVIEEKTINKTVYEQLKEIYTNDGAVAFLSALLSADLKKIGFPNKILQAYETRLSTLEVRDFPKEIDSFALKSDEEVWIIFNELIDLANKEEKIMFKDKTGDEGQIVLVDWWTITIKYKESNIKIKLKDLYMNNEQNIARKRPLELLYEIDELFGTNCTFDYVTSILDVALPDFEGELCIKKGYKSQIFCLADKIETSINAIKNFQIDRIEFMHRRKEYYEQKDENPIEKRSRFIEAIKVPNGTNASNDSNDSNDTNDTRGQDK